MDGPKQRFLYNIVDRSRSIPEATNDNVVHSGMRNNQPRFRVQHKSRPTKYAFDIISAEHDPKKQYARFYGAGNITEAVRSAKNVVSPMQSLSTHVPAKPEIKLKKSKRPKAKFIANATIGIALFMSSLLGFMAYRYHNALQKVEASPSQQESEADGSAGENETTGIANLDEGQNTTKGSGGVRSSDTPSYLSIPKLNVSGYVVSVGVKKSGAMNVPGNIWQVGWFKNSAKPKSGTGVVIMNGHVHGPTKPGIFYNLAKLNAGDLVTVSDVSGAKYNYKVVKKQTYKAGEVDADLYESASPDKQGLNLITCSGKIKDGEYEDRTVIFAERA